MARKQNGAAQVPGPEVDEIIVSLDPDSSISEQRRRRLLLRRFWQSASGF